MVENLSREQRKEIEAAYDTFDSNAKGFLTNFEYKAAFVALFGYKPSKYETHNLLSKRNETDIQQCNEWTISKADFMILACERMMQEDKFSRIKSSFQSIDLDNKGFIVWEDFKEAAGKLDISVSEPTLQKCFMRLSTAGQRHVNADLRCNGVESLHVTQRQFSLLWGDRISHVANEERVRLLQTYSPQ